MATVREGNKGVLVVVDVQVDVVKGAWDASRIVGNVARAVERARAEGEALIHKHFNSSFEQTSLDDELAQLGATHIVLAGCATNWCIRATAYGALERGYDLTLVKDAHTTKTMDLGDGTLLAAQNLVQDLNITMTCLSYPGRKNGSAKADEVAFATPGGVG